MKMDDFNDVLKDMQLKHVELLKKLNQICEKYNIKYWAHFGTLLGTIRHEGFIPWDDDLDIGMLREDYNKLRRVPAEEWGDEFMLCDPTDDDEIHDKPFPRIYHKKSLVQSDIDVENWHRWSDDKPWYTKLMCDIFIFEGVPEREIEFVKVYNKCERYRQLYRIAKLKPITTSRSITKRIKVLGKQVISRLLRVLWKEPWKTVDYWMKRLAKENRSDSMIGSYSSSDPISKHIYKKDEIFPLERKKFEDTYTYVPKEWDKVLTDLYGDYMTPPPEGQKTHLHLSFLNLGDGVSHVFSNPLPNSLAEEYLNTAD